MNLKYNIVSLLSTVVRKVRLFKLRLLGYKNISKSVIIEKNVTLDRLFPSGIHIGENTLIARNVTILSHDHIKRDSTDPNVPWTTNTYIGRNCFIGIGTIVLPGKIIGDEVVVGAGSVVSNDIPSNVIAAGNPVRILKKNIKMNNKAYLENINNQEN